MLDIKLVRANPDLVKENIKKKFQDEKLVLVDEGASDGTKKALGDACRYRGVELIQMGEQALGNAIGRPGRMAAAVTDAPFAERIRQLLTQAD